MAKLWLGSAALVIVLVAGPAVAADMPVKAPPMPPIITNWAGGYVGINGGWARADANWTFGAAGFFATTAGQGFSINPTGAVIGGHAGYNMESNSVVLGFELAGDWTNLKQTVVGPVPAFPFDSYTTKITDVETLTMRLGYAPGNWLIYGKAGIATGNVQVSAISGLPIPGEVFASTERVAGFAAGAGIETLWAEHFVFGVEYMFVSLSDSIHEQATCSVVATCGRFPTTPINLSTTDLRIQTLLGRLSYKF